MDMNGFCHPFRSHPGQGGLVAIAMTMLASLVIVGMSVGAMSQTTIKRNVTNFQGLQVYYVAQAGIQEGIASRMVPRTNYMNFDAVDDNELYPDSGRVYFDPENQTQLVGFYRYMIIGGDPMADPDDGTFELDRVDENISEQQFTVVSKGAVCQDSTGQVLPNQLTYNQALARPTCLQGNLKELTLTARADLSRTTTPDRDVISEYNVFIGNVIALEDPVDVPGYTGGPVNTFQFETAWNAITDCQAKPRRITFHELTDPANEREYTITGANTVVNGFTIDGRDVIRLKFGNGIDWRSIYGNDPDTCKNDPNTCNIRIEVLDASRNPTGAMFGASMLIPNFPSNNQVIIFPPQSNSDSMGTSWYRIHVDEDLQDYRGVALGTNYEIDFQI